MQLPAALSIYSPANRRRLLTVAGLMVVMVAALTGGQNPIFPWDFSTCFRL